MAGGWIRDNSFADGEPPPVDKLAWLSLTLPLAYLAFGAARKQLRPPAMLALQLAALVFYIGLTAVALSVDHDLARYLVGFGWIAHAFWDGAHHRANRAVPRPWAEWCGVVDLALLPRSSSSCSGGMRRSCSRGRSA